MNKNDLIFGTIFLAAILLCIPRVVSAQDILWEQTSGPGVLAINCLAVSGPDIFAGTTYSGVLRSTNGGKSWAETDSSLGRTSVISLIVSGANLFAGTEGHGLLLTTNSGTSWTQVDNGFTDIGGVAAFAEGGA